MPRLPWIAALAGLAKALAQPMALLHDPDTYLHIAAGRWVIAHHALAGHDPFSHTMAGMPWAQPEWLAEIVMAMLYSAFGWNGVVLATALCFAAALALLMHFLLRHLPPLPALIATVAGAAVVAPHLLARPHLLALPVLVAWSGGVLAARDTGRRPSWALLPLIVLWANLHGSFLFGLGLAGYLACEAVLSPSAGRSRACEARRWFGFVALASIAALLTPQGVFGLLAPLQLMAMPALTTGWTEWLSPNFQTAPALEFWLLGTLFVGLASGIKLPATRAALVVGLVHVTLQHVRHADLLGLVGPLVVAAPLGPQLALLLRDPHRAVSRDGTGASTYGALVAAVCGILVCVPIVLCPIVRDDDATTPAVAVAAARRLGLDGAVFNAEGFGGYLAFRDIKTFIDGRAELYGNGFLADYTAAERGDDRRLVQLLAGRPVEWALLVPDTPLTLILDNLPQWRRVFSDSWAVVYARQKAAP